MYQEHRPIRVPKEYQPLTLTYTALPAREGDPINQFIYFAYSAGRIKIGYTRGTFVRHKQLTYTGPFPPVIVLVMCGTIADEHGLHSDFDADRLHGEWFSLSEALRTYLRRRLCDIGRASLEQAEAEFRDYCEAFLATHRPAPTHKPRKHCAHGMPAGTICAPCERERDLAILERLQLEES